MLTVGQDLNCAVFNTIEDDQPSIVVNNETLAQSNDDLQALINCLPTKGELLLSIPNLSPKSRIVLEKAITIRSVMDPKQDEVDNQMVTVMCPPDGLFVIRCGTMLKL